MQMTQIVFHPGIAVITTGLISQWCKWSLQSNSLSTGEGTFKNACMHFVESSLHNGLPTIDHEKPQRFTCQFWLSSWSWTESSLRVHPLTLHQQACSTLSWRQARVPRWMESVL